MKLRLSWRDLDLAERFAVSRATVSNVHEFFDGVMIAVGIPSQQRCRESMPKSFEDFVSASFLWIAQKYPKTSQLIWINNP